MQCLNKCIIVSNKEVIVLISLQTICNFAEGIALWDVHINAYDQYDRKTVRIRRIVRDFTRCLNKMKEYFFYIQERCIYLTSPKVSIFLSAKNRRKLWQSKDLILEKIKYY